MQQRPNLNEFYFTPTAVRDFEPNCKFLVALRIDVFSNVIASIKFDLTSEWCQQK